MARRSSYRNSIIPEIGNRADAVLAMRGGAIAAWVVAGISTVAAAYPLIAAPDMGVGVASVGLGITEGLAFGIIGVFIWRESVVAAWLSLGLFTLGKIVQWIVYPRALLAFLVAAIVWVALLNGVRGAVALRRFKRDALNATAPTKTN